MTIIQQLAHELAHFIGHVNGHILWLHQGFDALANLLIDFTVQIASGIGLLLHTLGG
jgi:hypothetical protein